MVLFEVCSVGNVRLLPCQLNCNICGCHLADVINSLTNFVLEGFRFCTRQNKAHGIYWWVYRVVCVCVCVCAIIDLDISRVGRQTQCVVTVSYKPTTDANSVSDVRGSLKMSSLYVDGRKLPINCTARTCHGLERRSKSANFSRTPLQWSFGAVVERHSSLADCSMASPMTREQADRITYTELLL